MHSQSKSPKESRVKMFKHILEHFKPVFRYFFLEHYPASQEWFARRVAYSRSVACSSAIGYIVGLGDRHVSNILMDQRTAEVVHIDLGITFDQGQTLSVPETVPFRLTRDIVDGMGAMGTEGIFRRCFEETLSVLRNSQDALLTVLEVLLHDPLYKWSISFSDALKTQRVHGEEDGHGINDQSAMPTFEGRHQQGKKADSGNNEAMRVIFRLRQKLQGVEDGVAMSVTGQTNYLIEEARNEENLALLFQGWQAWL